MADLSLEGKTAALSVAGYAVLLLVILSIGCKRDDETPDTDTDDDDTDADAGADSHGVLDCSAVSDIEVAVLENDIVLENETLTKTVQTVLSVSWRQVSEAERVKLRFTFENGEWFESPTVPGTVGDHRMPVLGVPEETDVTIHIVSEMADETLICETTGRTGSLPKSVPRPAVTIYHDALSSNHRWLLGTVENTPDERSVYAGPFVVVIVDRQGRIVWYYLDQAYNPVMAYPRIAPDGSHFYVERSDYLGEGSSNRPSILKTTLDFRQWEEIDAPSLTDSMDITDDGSVVYTSDEWLLERTPDGEERGLWSCAEWAASHVSQGWDPCYANSVVWNPMDDSVVLSFPYINTVVEVSRRSGEILGQWGDATDSWAIEPSTLGLSFVHGANLTPDGTLLLSMHDDSGDHPAGAEPHLFVELALDRTDRAATEIWRYGEGLTDSPRWKGEMFPVDNGNRLLNYGSQGVIREVTPSGEVAWEVLWDKDFEDELINNMVGHTILVDDLYALSRGWETVE